jgi:hypothetical protein
MTSSRPGGVQQGFEDFGHGRVIYRRPGANDLRCQPRVARRQRLTQQGREIAIHLRHPVAREKILILPRNRPLKTHECIYPWGKPCLDPELGVRAVLTAAIGDPIINHQNLAVIAQIDRPRNGRKRGLPMGRAVAT